jgi:hypothetical protein
MASSFDATKPETSELDEAYLNVELHHPYYGSEETGRQKN